MPDTRTLPADVEAFLAAIDPEQRRGDARALVALMHAASGEAPRLWRASIIGFGSRHYRYESGREGDTFRIGFSPRKAQLVLYLTGAVAADGDLLDRLGPLTAGKGCLNLRRLERIDTAVLAELLARAWERDDDGAC
jgi:hypothetical protein